MRIGMLAPEFPPSIGGMHSLAWGLAEALAKTDEVTVYIPESEGERPNPAFEQRHVLTDDLHLDRARLAGEDVDLWLAMNGGLIPLAPRLDQPFFVYLHGSDFLMPWLTYGSRWLEPLRRPYLGDLKRALRRGAIRRAVPDVAHVFTNSTRTAELARQSLAIAAEDMTLCPPGVDDIFFQDRSPKVDGAPVEIVSVTRLTTHSARKNIDGVLRAIASLSDELALHYTVVGDGDDRPRLERLAAELGIADRVRFAGRIDTDDLLACYRRADLFVLASKASRYDVEGFGIVYIEACAGGVPAVCSAEGGATDAVDDGVNGIVIDDSSPQSIAKAIRSIASGRRSFSPETVRAFAEQFRWPQIAGLLRRRLAADLDKPAGRAVAA